MNSDTGGILGVFGFIVSMAGVIYTAINHKKIRCRCCGKDLDMSVEVDTEENNEENDDDESARVAESVAAAEKAKARLNEVTAIRVMSAQRSRSTSNDAYPDSLEPSRKKTSKGKIVPIVEA